MPTPLQMLLMQQRSGRVGRSYRPTTQRTPSPATSSISSAKRFGRGGLVASMLTGIPGLGVAGAGMGTLRDVRSFAGPYGAPQFKGSGPEHFASAMSGGVFGRNLRDQAIQAAAKINPAMNPADLYSGRLGRQTYAPVKAPPSGPRVKKKRDGGRTPGGAGGRREARARGYGARAR